MQIRKFELVDAIETSKLIKEDIQKVISLEDPRESVEEQIKEYSREGLIRLSKKANLFVAVQNNKIVGVAGFDKKYLFGVYVKYNLIGKGIGTKLVKRIIKEAKKKGLKQIFNQSSLFAEKFYLKLGFKRIRKLCVSYKGSTATYILMKKYL